MTYGAGRPLRDLAASRGAYAVVAMFRRDPDSRPTSVSDRELGVAALLLLLTVVVTTILVPALA